jgi:hypothetical protein
MMPRLQDVGRGGGSDRAPSVVTCTCHRGAFVWGEHYGVLGPMTHSWLMLILNFWGTVPGERQR